MVRFFEERQRRRTGGTHTPITAFRVAEVARTLEDNYGPTLPDDDAGRDDANVMAHILAHTRGGERNILAWLARAAPWMAEHEAVELARVAIAKPLRWTADKLAQRLGVTDEQRTRLRLRTIGAIDVTAAERIERRRERKRMAEEKRRRSRGAVPRSVYLRGVRGQCKPELTLGTNPASIIPARV